MAGQVYQVQYIEKFKVMILKAKIMHASYTLHIEHIWHLGTLGQIQE